MATDLLNIATSGVRAARAGLDTTAQNIANAGTSGYVRRSIALAELASPASYAQVSDLSFSGVTIGGYSRNVDAFRQTEVRRTSADSARAAAELGAFQNVETALEQAGLFPAMTAFETSMQHLSSDTTDPVLRTAAVEAARTLARTFNLAANALDTTGESLRFAATDGTEQVNRLARELGRTNLELSRATPGAADQIMLLDQRDNLLSQLAGYADIVTAPGPNQTVQVRIGGSTGPLLVDGIAVDALTIASAADGTISFANNAGAVTLTGGTLAGHGLGLIMVRDSRSGLDSIAADLIATANAAQGGNAALDGTPGQPLFSGNDAATIALALTSGAQLATAPAGAAARSRDPAGLNALRSALQDHGISGQIDSLLYRVSSAVQSRQTTADALAGIAGSARLALDAQAGVNLDDEAVNLLRFQQAFQASSKAIQIASDILDTLIALR